MVRTSVLNQFPNCCYKHMLANSLVRAIVILPLLHHHHHIPWQIHHQQANLNLGVFSECKSKVLLAKPLLCIVLQILAALSMCSTRYLSTFSTSVGIDGVDCILLATAFPPVIQRMPLLHQTQEFYHHLI